MSWDGESQGTRRGGQKPGSDVNGMHGTEIVSGLFFQLTLKILYK